MYFREDMELELQNLYNEKCAFKYPTSQYRIKDQGKTSSGCKSNFKKLIKKKIAVHNTRNKFYIRIVDCDFLCHK